MRRFISTVLVIFLLFVSVGCSKKEKLYEETKETETAEETENFNLSLNSDLTVISRHFDQEGFINGISQKDFSELLKDYSYDGKNVGETLDNFRMFYDGPYGGGCSCESDFAGWTNDYQAEDGVSDYLNRFSVYKPLEGLEFPFDIQHGDEISVVFSKLGINLQLDETRNYSATLFEDEKYTVSLKTNTSAASLDNFELSISENTGFKIFDTYELTQTREISFVFNRDGNTLRRVSYTMKDHKENK